MFSLRIPGLNKWKSFVEADDQNEQVHLLTQALISAQAHTDSLNQSGIISVVSVQSVRWRVAALLVACCIASGDLEPASNESADIRPAVPSG